MPIRCRAWRNTWAAGSGIRAGIRIARCGCMTATRRAGWASYVHESVKVDGRVGHLESNLLHFTCSSLSEHLKTMDRYTTLAAEQLLATGGEGDVGAADLRAAVDVFPDVCREARISGRRGRPGDREHGGAVQLREVCQGPVHEPGAGMTDVTRLHRVQRSRASFCRASSRLLSSRRFIGLGR